MDFRKYKMVGLNQVVRIEEQLLSTGETIPNNGQAALQQLVHDAGLCTGCGACVGLCPYQVSHQDKTIILHRCDLETGRCYAFCPRTPTDLGMLRRRLFAADDLTVEIGAVKGYFITRAMDPALRDKAQHGGTVTALMTLALKEGLIGTAVVAEGAEDLSMRGKAVRNTEEIQNRGKSRFVVAPMVAEFNRIMESNTDGVGMVATPCQALALAKMRFAPARIKAQPMERLKMVIGLFCGWTLSWPKITAFLAARGIFGVTGMDIPAGKQIVEIHAAQGRVELSMAEIQECIRDACRFCCDSTAEFADISVGSARLPGKPWEEMKAWNQVIVRTQQGMALLQLAKDRGILEFRPAHEGVLSDLKNAALAKKK